MCEDPWRRDSHPAPVPAAVGRVTILDAFQEGQEDMQDQEASCQVANAVGEAGLRTDSH